MSINLCKCVIRIGDGLAGWRKFLLFLIRPTQVLKHMKAIEQFYFNPSRFVIILPKHVQSLYSCNSGLCSFQGSWAYFCVFSILSWSCFLFCKCISILLLIWLSFEIVSFSNWKDKFWSGFYPEFNRLIFRAQVYGSELWLMGDTLFLDRSDCGMFMIKYVDFYSRGLGLHFKQVGHR